MRSVGATSGFIRFPFIVEGMVLGLLAGGVGYGLLYFVYSQLAKMFTVNGQRMTLIPFDQVWVVLLAGFLAGGVLTGMLGSAISMGKYLKEQGGNSD